MSWSRCLLVPGDPNGPGDQLYVPIIGRDLPTPPCPCSADKFLPSTDRRLRGKVQRHPEGDAEEDGFRRWQGLGQAPPVCTLCISGSPSGVDWILTLRAIVWAGSVGSTGRTEGGMGSIAKQRRKRGITHPTDARTPTTHKRASARKHRKGQETTKAVVRPNCPQTYFGPRRPSAGTTANIDLETACTVAGPV